MIGTVFEPYTKIDCGAPTNSICITKRLVLHQFAFVERQHSEAVLVPRLFLSGESPFAAFGMSPEVNLCVIG